MRKKIIMMIMGVALLALPAMAQVFSSQQSAVRDQNKYQTAAPSAAFQSTSAMSGSGSAYSANPMLNSDGTAAYGNATYSSSGPRRAKKEDNDWPSSQDPGEGSPESPIGDAVVPLMLMVGAYLIVRAARRRRC